jgi:anti-anti-sigma factor
MDLIDDDEAIDHGTDAIELEGRLDGRSSAEVRDALYEHIERHPREDVRVDCSRVESIDATVLNLLAAAAVKVRRAGGSLILIGCTPGVRRVISHPRWRRLFRMERPSTS